MKNTFKIFICVAIFYAMSASAGIRCNEPTLKNQLGGLVVRDGYRVLTWAHKCQEPMFQALRNKVQLQTYLFLADSDEGTKGGTYFPDAGTSEYEAQRVNVWFPIFFVPGSVANYWKAMFEPGEIQTRIFNQPTFITYEM